MERPDLVRELGLVARAEFEEALDAKKRIFAHITHLESQLQTTREALGKWLEKYDWHLQLNSPDDDERVWLVKHTKAVLKELERERDEAKALLRRQSEIYEGAADTEIERHCAEVERWKAENLRLLEALEGVTTHDQRGEPVGTLADLYETPLTTAEAERVSGLENDRKRLNLFWLDKPDASVEEHMERGGRMNAEKFRLERIETAAIADHIKGCEAWGAEDCFGMTCGNYTLCAALAGEDKPLVLDFFVSPDGRDLTLKPREE